MCAHTYTYWYIHKHLGKTPIEVIIGIILSLEIVYSEYVCQSITINPSDSQLCSYVPICTCMYRYVQIGRHTADLLSTDYSNQARVLYLHTLNYYSISVQERAQFVMVEIVRK